MHKLMQAESPGAYQMRPGLFCAIVIKILEPTEGKTTWHKS